jgi:hypothetical protein
MALLVHAVSEVNRSQRLNFTLKKKSYHSVKQAKLRRRGVALLALAVTFASSWGSIYNVVSSRAEQEFVVDMITSKMFFQHNMLQQQNRTAHSAGTLDRGQ